MPKRDNRRGRGSQRPSPKKGRAKASLPRGPSPPFVATVRDLASDGRGVVVDDAGQVVFVPGVWPGETVHVRIVQRGARFAVGELVSVEVPAPARQTPPCEHHGFGPRDCGGCPWMFVSYDAQCDAKWQRLQRAVAALPVTVTPHTQRLAAPEPLGYRNRAELKTDGEALGFVASGQHNLAPVEDCPVLVSANREQLRALRQQLPNREWRPARGKTWTTLAIDDEGGPVRINQRLPFRQGNSRQNAVMRRWLAGHIETLPARAGVLELYAGSGNFTAMLATGERPVLALEGDAEAVERLNALQLPRVDARVCNLDNASLVSAYAPALAAIEALVMDPPRAGCPNLGSWLDHLPKLHTLIYVACDLATWQRDVTPLFDEGWSAREISLLDMFPQTPHLEILSVFERVAR